MLESFDIVSFVLGLVIGAISCVLLRDKWLETRCNRLANENKELETLLYSAKQRERGLQGIAAKQEKAERLQGIMLEVATAAKEGKDIQEVLKETAMKNPDIAFELLRKGLKI